MAILLGVLQSLEVEEVQARHTPSEEERRRVKRLKERMGWSLGGLKMYTRWLRTEY